MKMFLAQHLGSSNNPYQLNSRKRVSGALL